MFTTQLFTGARQSVNQLPGDRLYLLRHEGQR